MSRGMNNELDLRERGEKKTWQRGDQLMWTEHLEGRTKGDWGMVERWRLEHWWGEQHWGEGKLSTKSGEADSEPWPQYSHSPSCSLSPSLSPLSTLSFCLPACLPPPQVSHKLPLLIPLFPPIPPSLSDPLADCPTWLGEREKDMRSSSKRKREYYRE